MKITINLTLDKPLRQYNERDQEALYNRIERFMIKESVKAGDSMQVAMRDARRDALETMVSVGFKNFKNK